MVVYLRAEHDFKHLTSMEQVSSRGVKVVTKNTGEKLRTTDKDENHHPSSTIEDWLKDPKNEFMHLGPDRINRSCSSVHSRPLCNFLKNSFYASLRSPRDDNVDDMDIETFKANLQEHIKLDKPAYRFDKDQERSSVCLHESSPLKCQHTRTSTLKEILAVTDVKKEKSKTFPRQTQTLQIESNRKNKNWCKTRDVDTSFDLNAKRSKRTDTAKNIKQKKAGVSANELTLLSPDMTFFLPNSTKDNNNNEIQQSPSESEASVTESMSAASTGDSHCSSKHVILNGNALELKRLADEGFDFNFIDEDGYSALHYGAMRGNGDIISLILDNGGNVWKKTEQEELAVELSSNLSTKMLLTGATMFYKEENGVDNEHRLRMKPMSFEL